MEKQNDILIRARTLLKELYDMQLVKSVLQLIPEYGHAGNAMSKLGCQEQSMLHG